jgi:carboxyl-terminal processing protease
LTQVLFGQGKMSEVEKLSTLCKVWGFLKYYHPKVSKGKYDWDKELLKKISIIKKINTKPEINETYISWINSIGKVKKRKHEDKNISDSLKINLTLDWINDTTVFNKELISRLNYIKENRKNNKYYSKYGMYAYRKEKMYKDSVFPEENGRLLTLFRYWNIIEYYFPYKYMTDNKWSSVLNEMIPVFQNSKDTTSYHLAILELITKTNDSHAQFWTPYTYRYFGIKWPAFKFNIIDSNAIITGYFNDSLARIDDLQKGDVILKINNKPISDVITEKSKYISASNESVKLRELNYCLFHGNTDTILIEYERSKIVKSKIIRRYDFNKLKYNWAPPAEVVYKELNDNIGYINIGQIKVKQVDSIMKKFMNKQGIILDIRNYPNGTAFVISQYLNRDIKSFVKFMYPNLSYPGVYEWSRLYYTGKKRGWYKWYGLKDDGTKNENYYKGKVVVLINEVTQSQAEFTCMALKTAPNIKFIGSQTAGADGNVVVIPFPGGYTTWMSGLGVYYPNGKETQRIGIISDIFVKPTIEGIRSNKDEILEKAIDYIKNNQ